MASAGSGMAIGAAEDAPKQAMIATAQAKMDLARLAGFGTVRVTQVWVKGQTSLSSFDQTALQNAATAATLDGVRLVVAIYNYKSSNTPLTATDRAQFAQYAQAVVRTVPGVTDFVIGNEPNNNLFWQPQFNADGSDAAAPAFEQLLAQAYDAVKSVRPAARIFGAGLAPRGGDSASSSKPTHSPVTFIRDMGSAYRASGRTAPIMDVFDQHVYEDTSSVPPSFDHPGNNTISVSDYPKLVTTLGTAFDGTGQPGSTLPIVYGEFGVESLIPSDKASRYTGTEPTSTKPVDEATQGAYYVQALKIAYCQATVIGIMLFHVSDEPDLAGWQSGLDYVDDSAKTSLPLVRDAIGAANAGTLTSCPDSTPPTVQLDAPADGSTLTGPVTLSATASDDVGINRVEFLVNGTVIGYVAVPPYRLTWTPTANGGYTVAARALDAVRNSSTSSATVTIASPPSISSFVPTSGAVGASVTVNGTNLTGASSVTFNGTAATAFTVNSDTKITATVPAGATSGLIGVSTPGGSATSSSSFTVIPAPAVTSFTPTSGPVGTSVTVNGTNFTGATSVTFNGIAATAFTVNSATKITASVPTGATTGSVAVTTPGGTGTSSSNFTVTTVTTPTLTAGPSSVSSGGSVTVTWSGVSGPTTTDWIAVYTPGAANTSFLNWMYDSSCTKTAGSTAKASGSCSFAMPTTAGTYEFRLLANDGYTTVATSGTVTVTGSSGPTLTTNVSSVPKGGKVTVSWTGVSGPKTKDWIGLYKTGAANTAYTSWIYDSSCTQTAGSTAKASGSCQFTMPNTTGTYEFRLFANDGYTVIAKSGTISVA